MDIKWIIELNQTKPKKSNCFEGEKIQTRLKKVICLIGSLL